MCEGPIVISQVVEGLAEGKMDIERIARRQTVRLGQRLERRQIGIAGAKGL